MKQFSINIVLIVILIVACGDAAMGIDSRLIAQSHYNGSGGNLVAFDSQAYIYPNMTAAVYNQKLGYQYNGTAWIHLRKHDYTYNSADKMIAMQFQNWNTSTSAYVNGGLTFFTLNTDGYCIKDSNVLWIPANSAYRNNVRNNYTVNSAGQITEQVYDYWDAGANALLPHYRYTNSYNAQGNPLVRLTQDWDASITWMNYVRVTYAYDASGTQVQTMTGEQAVATPGILQTVYQNVFTLNADGSVASYLSNVWNSGSSSYGPSMSITMAYDADGNNILETYEQWDAAAGMYKPYQQYVRTYNSYNQKTSDTRMMWNGSAYATYSSRDNYYYEEYGSSTGTGNMAVADAKLSVYPVPSTGDLHIALGWAEAQGFTAIVTDMNGRSCYTFSAAAGKEYTGNINLSNLPDGNYVLSIRGSLGGVLSRMIVLQR